ncbi:glycoside hydrolase family 30 protein [Geodermatophilus obscurus]|uniref:Glycoside hydrolase family 30 n=1 Tax=Geodermatophilus obscurus (strain ATCC 25078 / DSM 43160 / JCM 3152 / CCUG 61914 / KCC A-0152 / KCTC 9177 / NBRC 13315 / NRRL B-3577 / G-20) TaxID=526225 RepID=D2SC74_GEOOG|nr:glycoside hydrolase family 30 beta sandwich domain-containing protein [Geodermatophilus obscurus]ADB74242.1 glycoside hydrolase family 30 [Geodermatophilus obscurus DSM 43160]
MRARRSRVVTVAVGVALLVGAQVGGSDRGAVPPAEAATGPTLRWWLTTGPGEALLSPQRTTAFGRDRTGTGAVTVGEEPGQEVVGVGAALTESSAVLLGGLPPAARHETLRQLFDPATGAGISVLRVPLGASDFALDDHTYDDVPPGETDEDLSSFSIDPARRYVLPVLSEALAVNPAVRVVLTPWSAPAWMKTSGTTHGGRLGPVREDVYADYLVRAVADLRAAGAPVVALTLANEPGHEDAGYPSMLVDAGQQERLAIAVRARLDGAGLGDVDVLAHDHNWDDTATPVSLLTGPAADAYAGAAFHCYGGDVSAQSAVAAAVPSTRIWTTECSGGTWSTSWSGDLRWGARHVLIGGFRNSSAAVLWWNLALDPDGGPTNGGCTNCRGVLTVDPATGSVTPSVEYWLLSHAGRFVPRGSVRLPTPERTAAGVESVAFRTPSGGHVLLLLNDAGEARRVPVRWAGRSAVLEVPAGGLVTATW